MQIPRTHCKMRHFHAIVAILTVPVVAASAPPIGQPIDPSKLFNVEPLKEDMLEHPDPEIRQVATQVEVNGQRHRRCTSAWLSSSLRDTHFGLWAPGGDTYDLTTACRAEGGQPFVASPSGNDTSAFPHPILLCLPPDCDVSFVREYWLPRLLLTRLQHLPGRTIGMHSLRQVLGGARVLVEHAVRFPRPDLPSPRLVIAGFPFSGTTSIATELRRHPRIAIPMHEDQVYWRFFHTPRSLAAWRERYRLAEARKRAALPRNASPRTILGLKDPFLAWSEEGMKAVAKVPGVKVIVMLRDPITMIQTWINHGAHWANPHGDMMGYNVGFQGRVVNLIVSSAIPRERLLVVPTLALDHAPLLVYRRIMQFIGLPETTRRPFRIRENRLSAACVAIGRCFDFCKAPLDLLVTVHALFKLEAQQSERLLRAHGWPPQLASLARPLPARCPGRGGPWPDPEPGLCHALPSAPGAGFRSEEECRECCERQVACKPYSVEFERLCVPLERVLIRRAQALTRRALCGKSRSTSLPCAKGFGRHITAMVP